MIQLTAPERIENGKPIHATYQADSRVAGRLRLTLGTDALEFTLSREGRDPVTSAGPRVRGRSGAFVITDWGDHASGTELVLRFEGAKCWMVVA